MNHAPNPDIAHHAPAGAVEHEHASPPIKLYLQIWGLLFVLSAMSYAVDYFAFQGIARWTLIIIFMLLKAGLIVAIFMHMAWERMALVYAILVPPLALGTLVWLMWIESDYTFWTRILFFDRGA